MDVYFGSSTAATTLKASDKMGTAGRFAIKFGDDGDWRLFKVDPADNSTAVNYYTDKAAEGATRGDYAVTSENGNLIAKVFTYLDFSKFAGSIGC